MKHVSRLWKNMSLPKQYPGAGNAQFVFGGTRMPEDKAISAVGDTFPVPAVDGIVKITIY